MGMNAHVDERSCERLAGDLALFEAAPRRARDAFHGTKQRCKSGQIIGPISKAALHPFAELRFGCQLSGPRLSMKPAPAKGTPIAPPSISLRQVCNPAPRKVSARTHAEALVSREAVQSRASRLRNARAFRYERVCPP
jgi:hypothetical protein